MDVVLFYSSSHPFSNFYKTTLEVDGMYFTSSEQAFMYMKARHFKDESAMKWILSATTPLEAKKVGRRVVEYTEEEWESVRLKYMTDVCMAKFSQNEKLKSTLLSTGDSLLAEASPHDLIWGIGLSDSDPDARVMEKWKGRNLLGAALMEVR